MRRESMWGGEIKFLLTHPVWDVTKSIPIQPHIPQFLLTHPVWDVTELQYAIDTPESDFYSHIPCGMWHKKHTYTAAHSTISTHTSRVGCDMFSEERHVCKAISTHTSRVGCDIMDRLSLLVKANFYSHIPCGMWRQRLRRSISCRKFLLTHPVWDVT